MVSRHRTRPDSGSEDCVHLDGRRRQLRGRNFPQWDRIREEIKPRIVALVTEKSRPVVVKAALPDIVVKRATWDVLYMAMEYEFAEVIPPSFFDTMAAFYLHGHFPCGWEGSWPEGELIVF